MAEQINKRIKEKPMLPFQIVDEPKDHTECAKCLKLELCCESYEESKSAGKCLRCNHSESDHCLESGSSTRPFPLLLFPPSKQKTLFTKIDATGRTLSLSNPQQILTENASLRAELLNLQSELKSARTLVNEMTNGSSYAPPNSYHGFFLDAHLLRTVESLNDKLHSPQTTKLNRRQILPQPDVPRHKKLQSLANSAEPKHPISLSSRLRDNLSKTPTEREEGKCLMKNISRHTLITRGFINSHFEKLEAQGNTGRVNTITLFSTLRQVQRDLITNLQWVQTDCFEAFYKKSPSVLNKEDYSFVLKDFLPPVIKMENNVLLCLSRLSIDQHRSMAEVIATPGFKEFLTAVKSSLNGIIEYGEKFPNVQCSLEELFEEFPESTTFLKSKTQFSGNLLVPLHHPSNYVQFFSEVLELLKMGDPFFKQTTQLLSEIRTTEKRVCEIVSNFNNVSSTVRSQRKLFSGNNKLKFDTKRLLVREQDVLLYNSEHSNRPFFQRFERMKLFVFSDVIVFDTSNVSSRIICPLDSLVTVHENPRGICKFQFPAESQALSQVLESSFLLVTLAKSFFVCCDSKLEKLETAEDILTAFRDLIRTKVKHKSSWHRGVTFSSLNGNMFYANTKLSGAESKRITNP